MSSSPAMTDGKEKEKSVDSKVQEFFRDHSVWDLIDPSKPWVLVEGGSFLGFFDFVPEHYRCGPWSLVPLSVLPFILSLVIKGAVWLSMQKGLWEQFVLPDDSYEAFTLEWYYTLAASCWMVFIMWHIYARSPASIGAWVTFTVWSWTIITIRHFLVLVAPFFRSVRLASELLRFPALLSATITSGIWNFVLFPAIVLYFVKDLDQRKKFIGFFTNFRLTQLHVFNFFFAVANCAYVSPVRPLHIGDTGPAGIFLCVYMAWYYCVLDRLGIHLYPIFSPRTPLVLFSWMLIIGACAGGYEFWKGVLA